MTDAQIHARAVIASALIRHAFVSVNSVEDVEGEKGAQLRAMVDAVFSAVINPKPKRKPKP